MARTHISFEKRMFELHDSDLLIWLFVAHQVASSRVDKDPWFNKAASLTARDFGKGLVAIYSFSWEELVSDPREVVPAIELCEMVVGELTAMGDHVRPEILMEIKRVTHQGLLLRAPYSTQYSLNAARTMTALLSGKDVGDESLLPITDSPV